MNKQVTEGTHAAQVDPAAVRALAKRFEAAGFFGLQDIYCAPATDLPTYTLSLTVDGRTKTFWTMAA